MAIIIRTFFWWSPSVYVSGEVLVVSEIIGVVAGVIGFLVQHWVRNLVDVIWDSFALGGIVALFEKVVIPPLPVKKT